MGFQPQALLNGSLVSSLPLLDEAWCLIKYTFADFVVSKVTPQMITALGYKIFIMFATINIGGMATFA